MKLTRVVLALLLALPLAAVAKGERVEVKLAKGGRFTVDAYTFGPIELTGYLGELKDGGATTAVLISPRAPSAEDSRKFTEAVVRAGLKPMLKDSGGERELTVDAPGEGTP